MMSVFADLKRRNVFRVAAAYTVVGWPIIQVAETVVVALGYFSYDKFVLDPGRDGAATINAIAGLAEVRDLVGEDQLLGAEPKDRVLLEGGHLPPMNDVARETLDWFDQHLAAVPQ